MSIILSIIILSNAINYTGGFQEGDWVNFTNFRYVTSAATDQTIIYFGTTGGVIRYDRYAKRWLDPLTITDGIPHERINDIAYDPATGRIWVNTVNGAAYYQPTFNQWYSGGQFPHELARNDFYARDFPILTTEFGYSYMDGAISDFNMLAYPLTMGVSDGYDFLYVGTWGLGPVIINTRYGDLNRLPFGPYNENISSIVVIDDLLWLGDNRLSGGTLTLFDMAGEKWEWYLTRYTDGLTSSQLTSGASGSKNAWLGTEYGLVRYRINEDDFFTYADFSTLPSTLILSVAANSIGTFAGTDNGLGFISSDKKPKNNNSDSTGNNKNNDHKKRPVVFPVKSLVGFRINCLEIINDFLYLGTHRGVIRVQLEGNKEFEYVDTPEGMLLTEIYDIDNSGDSLYFLTDRDIQIINPKTGESSSLTDYRYFDRWQLRYLEIDDENIWAATDIGLWKYRISDGYSRLFTASDGMISDDIRGLVLNGDYIWLATPRGLIRFFWNDPGRID
ncbi:MAG: hypothetical protein V3W18_08335 [candidate division Zixibacteria bacterium]